MDIQPSLTHIDANPLLHACHHTLPISLMGQSFMQQRRNLQLGKLILQRLQERTGGYQGIDAGGNQVLLNYRSLPSWQTIAPQVSLTQV